MSSVHQVTVGDLLYNVVDDCTTTYWALLTGSVTDEIFGDAVAAFTVVTGRADLQFKASNGLFALTGYPDVSFPQHSTNAYNLNLQLKAPGYRDQKWLQSVPAGVPFPIQIAVIKLRRLPVRIQGRVVNDVTRAAIAGAQVISVDDPVTPPTVHTTAVRSPLYFDHPLTSQVQGATMTTPVALNLTEDVAAGDKILNLQNRAGLAGNPVIQLRNASRTAVEYAVVDHLGPGAPAAGQVYLRNALNRSYPKSASVTHFIPNLVGGPTGLLADANAGDGVLLAGQLLNSAPALVVDSGLSTEEYHEVGAFTDNDGYFALDGMGRVRELFLFSSQGALQQTVPWFIEYDHAVNVVDLRLS